MLTLILASALALPIECPQYCVSYSIQLVAECSKKAKQDHPTDEQKFVDAFSKCLDKAKENELYKRCKKVCDKETRDGKEKSEEN